MKENSFTFSISSEKEMEALGKQLSKVTQPGMVVFLLGDLGAGKTTFSRGFIQGLGHQGVVRSPTYNIVQPYQIDQQAIYHFDLYRIADQEELEAMGIRDYFDGKAYCLLEWPEKGQDVLPEADLLIKLDYQQDSRKVSLQPGTQKGADMLDRFHISTRNQ